MGRCPARGPFVAAESPAAQVVQGRLTRNFLLMYDPNRLEWHPGDETEDRPPQVAVWSCKVAGEAFASVSTATLLLCQEPRPQSILLGVFAFGQPDAVRRWSGLGYPATRASQSGERGRIPRARWLKQSGIVRCDGMAPGSTKHRANFGHDHGKAVLCSNIHQKAMLCVSC